MGLFGLFGGKKEQSEYEGDGCVAIVPPLEPPRVPVDDGEGGLMLVWCDRVFFFFSLFLTHSPLFFETPAPSPFFRASATTRPASSRCRNAPPESSTAASKAPREGAHSAPRGSASALSLGQNPRTLSLFSGVKKKRRRRPKKIRRHISRPGRPAKQHRGRAATQRRERPARATREAFARRCSRGGAS